MEPALLVEVLDRVLDKGVVIDARAHVSLAGLNLVTIEAHVLVAALDPELDPARALGRTRAGHELRRQG